MTPTPWGKPQKNENAGRRAPWGAPRGPVDRADREIAGTAALPPPAAGLATLPNDSNRTETAAMVLRDVWTKLAGAEPDVASIFALVTAGLIWSNFGRVNSPSGVVETNNWLKLGGYDKTAADCTDGLTVFDSATNRCVFTFPTVEEGVLYTLKSVLMAPALVEALKTGDIGRIAEAFLNVGYNYPAKLTQDNWAILVTSLRDGSAQVMKETDSSINPLKVTDYVPKFTDGTETKPPSPSDKTDGDKTDEEKSKGWSTGAMVGAGLGVLAVVGLAVWGLKSGSSETVAYQNNPAKRKLPPQPYLRFAKPHVAKTKSPPEDFASLVAIFAEARDAALRAAEGIDDGGSSNFDEAYIFGESATSKNLKAAEEAGLKPVKNGKNKIELTNPVYAQGYKRTAQAKAIADVLNANGIESSVSYIID